jgi:hypothetical protein
VRREKPTNFLLPLQGRAVLVLPPLLALLPSWRRGGEWGGRKNGHLRVVQELSGF